ncbi:MAG: Mth938-like domain-containing protein [Burkholderiaceae bacterium]|jgi:uncharacterized protein
MGSKLQADPLFAAFTFTGYGSRYVEINRQAWGQSVIVQTDAAPVAWGPAVVSGITPADLQQLTDTQAEVILIGTGDRQVFLPAPLLGPLRTMKGYRGLPVGLEVMSTQAACRTFNLLAAEGRRVVAAVVIEAPTLLESSP